MICLDSEIFTETINFWFKGESPVSTNAHFIFAITTFVVSAILVVLNNILIITKNVDLLKLNITEELNESKKIKTNKYYLSFLWVVGSFLISLILTTTEIVNIKIISCVIVGFTWDKLFVQLSKMTNNDNPNPDNYE